jgi:hypothetical protein
LVHGATAAAAAAVAGVLLLLLLLLQCGPQHMFWTPEATTS